MKKLPIGVLEMLYPFTPLLVYEIFVLIPWIGLKMFIAFYVFMFYFLSFMVLFESEKFIYRRPSLIKNLIVAMSRFVWKKYIKEYVTDFKEAIIYFTNTMEKVK